MFKHRGMMHTWLHFLIAISSIILSVTVVECQSHQTSYGDIINSYTRSSSHLMEVDLDESFSSVEGITRDDVIQATRRFLNSLEESGDSFPTPSPECSNHTTLVLDGLIAKQKWAREMLDSFGKPGSGLLQYELQWLGSFDECVDVVVNISQGTRQPFQPKYCLSGHPLKPGPVSAFTPMFELGSCFPDTCSEFDVLLILKGVLSDLPIGNLTVDFVKCQENSLPLDGAAVAVILTPPYMLVIMVYVPLFKYWGSGPLFPQQGIDPNCKTNIWTNLLYIQNIVKADNQCMGWAWYLANDMQFYWLSPLIFVPFFYSKVLGSISSGVFLLATTITAGVLTSYYDIPSSIVQIFLATFNGSEFQNYYMKPWCRMGPYIVGLVAGYILYKTDCRIRMNKYLCLLGWCCAAAICLAVVYGEDGLTHGHPMTKEVTALYNALNRTAWGVGVAWVIIACATGNGGYVNTILSWEALIPLSRLTYCAYLVHPVIMTFYYFSRHSLIFLSDMNMIYCFFGHLVASYMVAAVVSLMFESPMMGLEKVIFPRKK